MILAARHFLPGGAFKKIADSAMLEIGSFGFLGATAGTGFAGQQTAPWKAGLDMDDRQARRHAFSEWLLEFSVLWAVFPLLDQLVENEAIDLSVLAWSLGISWTALVVGIILRRGDVK